MDYDPEAVDAQIKALLKQNEATLAALPELLEFSVNKTLQEKGIDPDAFNAWLRSQVPPEEMKEIDNRVGRQLHDMTQALTDAQTTATSGATPARRRNMV